MVFTLKRRSPPDEHELDRIQRRESEERDIAAKEFERLHAEGAQRFGLLWLTANEIVAKCQSVSYVPKDAYGNPDIRIKALLSAAAWEVAEYLSPQDGTARKPVPIDPTTARLWPTPKPDAYFTPKKLSPARYLLLQVLVRGGYLVGQFLKNERGDTLYRVDVVISKWANGVTEMWSADIPTSDGDYIRSEHRKLSDRGRAVWAHQQKFVKAQEQKARHREAPKRRK